MGLASVGYHGWQGYDRIHTGMWLRLRYLPNLGGVGGAFPILRAYRGKDMRKAKQEGLRVARCSKYIRAITGSGTPKGQSPIKLAYRLLTERIATKRGQESIVQFIDNHSHVMQATIDQAIIPRKTKKAAVDFLLTYEWRKLRMQAIAHYGAKCMCCGASPETGAVINVDHIKPRKLFPKLALDFDNLQILCSVCNHGKGNWDMTDWRPKRETA
jgi:hypothetical protein